MQDGVPQAPHWLQYGLSIVAAILGGVGIDRLYNSWLHRKKPIADIHKTEAETTETHVRARSSAVDALGRMMDRLDAAQVTIDGMYETLSRVRSERDQLKMRVDLMVIAEQSMKDQLDSAVAYIKFLGKHPTDVDRFRVQMKSEISELDHPKE